MRTSLSAAASYQSLRTIVNLSLSHERIAEKIPTCVVSRVRTSTQRSTLSCKPAAPYRIVCVCVYHYHMFVALICYTRMCARASASVLHSNGRNSLGIFIHCMRSLAAVATDSSTHARIHTQVCIITRVVFPSRRALFRPKCRRLCHHPRTTHTHIRITVLKTRAGTQFGSEC